MIDIQKVTKTFGNTHAVKDLSMHLSKGETIALIGPSGSGKTTLLELIAGLETPDMGVIMLNGNQASGEGKINIKPNHRQIGMIFQNLALWPHMSITNNIAFGLKNLGLKKSQCNRKIETISEQLDISHTLNRYPHTLSGGEQQRAALARALVMEPAILLMDEPLSNLDTVLKNDLLSMILDLIAQRQTTLIYVTHNRDEAIAIPGKKAVMLSGKLIQLGSVMQLSKSPNHEFIKRFMQG